VPFRPRQQREVEHAAEDFNTRYRHPVQWWDRERLRSELADLSRRWADLEARASVRR